MHPSLNRASLKKITIAGIVLFFGLTVITMIILSIANYPVQWRQQVDIERKQDLKLIDQALTNYYLDHSHALPVLPQGPVVLSNIDQCAYACKNLNRSEVPCLNLQKILVPNYLRVIPQDPLLVSDTDSGYYLQREGNTVRLGVCRSFFSQEIVLDKSYE